MDRPYTPLYDPEDQLPVEAPLPTPPDCPGGEHEATWMLGIGEGWARLRHCAACRIDAELRGARTDMSQADLEPRYGASMADAALRVLYTAGRIEAIPTAWGFRSLDPIDHAAQDAASRAWHAEHQAADSERRAAQMAQARTSLRSRDLAPPTPEPDWNALRGPVPKAAPPLLADPSDALPPWERAYLGLSPRPVRADDLTPTDTAGLTPRDPAWWTPERKAAAAEAARQGAAERKVQREADERHALESRLRALELRRERDQRKTEGGQQPED